MCKNTIFDRFFEIPVATSCGCRLPILGPRNWTRPDLQTLRYLGIKLNSKVTIFDSHLAPIYYMHVKQYNYIWLNKIEVIRSAR